jgi:hypothetical protein
MVTTTSQSIVSALTPHLNHVSLVVQVQALKLLSQVGLVESYEVDHFLDVFFPSVELPKYSMDLVDLLKLLVTPELLCRSLCATMIQPGNRIHQLEAGLCKCSLTFVLYSYLSSKLFLCLVRIVYQVLGEILDLELHVLLSFSEDSHPSLLVCLIGSDRLSPLDLLLLNRNHNCLNKTRVGVWSSTSIMTL